MKSSITFFLALMFFSLNIQAANMISSSAEYKNDKFIIKAVGIVNSSPENVFALLTDYANLTQLSPKFIESTILKKNDNVTTVRIIIKGCVWIFCRQIINTQNVISKPIQHIQAITIPIASNLKFGKMLWDIQEDGSGSKIEYHAEIELDFFIPPFVGIYFTKRTMLEEAKIFIDNVEKLTSKKG